MAISGSGMTSGQHIDYEAMAQNALRGVVRAVLVQVARTGLLGEHHFYIAFNTDAPGVAVSKRLREKYPNEMTIVLQHRFWDLEIGEDRFEVKLTFDGIPERLVVPFQAVKVFYDPSVPYGLQFEESENEIGGETGRRSAGGSRVAMQRPDNEKRRAPRRPRSEGKIEDGRTEAGSAEKQAAPAASTPAAIGPRPALVDKAKPAKPVVVAPAAVADSAIEAIASDTSAAPAPAPAATDSSSKVVDLSKFRKK